MNADGPWLVFRSAGRRFHVPASAVAEVVRRTRITRAPGAPDWLIGLANVRGRIVPVVNAVGGGWEGGEANLLVLADRRLAVVIDQVESLGADVSAAEPLDLDALRQRALAVPTLARRTHEADSAAPAAGVASGTPYLEVAVAGQAYALRLEAVVAVAAIHDGRLIHQGAELPVARLADKLGLRGGGSRACLVLDAGDGLVGLAVDEVRPVLRPRPEEVVSAPAALNRNTGGPRIDRLVRAGGRLIAVLEPAAVAAGLPGARVAAAPARGEIGSTEGLAFTLGGAPYVVPLAAVDEVCALGPVVRAPRAPPRVVGVVNRRGAVLPVLADGSEASGERAVVVRQGTERMVLPVDALRGVVAFETCGAGRAGEGLWGAATRVETATGPMLVLDPALLSAAVRVSPAAAAP